MRGVNSGDGHGLGPELGVLCRGEVGKGGGPFQFDGSQHREVPGREEPGTPWGLAAGELLVEQAEVEERDHTSQGDGDGSGRLPIDALRHPWA